MQGGQYIMEKELEKETKHSELEKPAEGRGLRFLE